MEGPWTAAMGRGGGGEGQEQCSWKKFDGVIGASLQLASRHDATRVKLNISTLEEAPATPDLDLA